MDNITHSLFGVATAKIINAKVNKSGDKKTTAFIYFVSIFAANFPDLDILMSLIDPGPLGYLLHHRGHTHTFLYLIPQLFLLYVLSIFAFGIQFTSVRLAGLGAIGINMSLHLFLDFQNSYGVHPFAPFNNHWFYNDNLFIIEPLLWFTMLPMILTPIPNFKSPLSLIEGWGQIRRTVLWLFTVTFFLGILFLAFKAHYFTSVIAVMLVAVFLVYMIVFHFKSSTTKAWVSLISALLVMQIFSLARNKAYDAIATEYQQSSFGSSKIQGQDFEIFDIILSPMPSQPFCWKFITVSSDKSKVYALQSGVYQLFRTGPFVCPEAVYSQAKTSMVMHQHKPVVIEGTYTSRLKVLVEDLGSPDLNCKRDQWLQFVRAPFREQKDIYKDLRFERETNFTKIDLKDEKVRCVKFQVPWIPPRHDLIQWVK